MPPDSPPSAHFTTVGGQIPMYWPQMPSSRTGQPGCVMPTILGTCVLSYTQNQQARMILLAPVWKTQPWYPRNANRSPMHNRAEGTNYVPSRSLSTGTPVSRMAYLQDQHRGHKLSEEATSLLLKSWRSKTNKSYDSLFRKWHSWCSERGADPVYGSAKEVANFLASLHAKGYHQCLSFSYLIGA